MNTLKKLFSLLFVVSHLFCSERPLSKFEEKVLSKLENGEEESEQVTKADVVHVVKTLFKLADAKWNAVWEAMGELGLGIPMRHAAEEVVFKADNVYQVLSDPYAPESIINFCATFTWCIDQGYISDNDTFIQIINETKKPTNPLFPFLLVEKLENLNIEKYNEAKRECLLDLQYYIFDMFEIYSKRGKMISLASKNLLNTYYDLKKRNEIVKEHIRLKLNQRRNFLQDFREKYIAQMNLLDKNDAARQNLHLDIMKWNLELENYNAQKVKHDQDKARSRRIFHFKLMGISSLAAIGDAIRWFKFRKK